MTQSKSDADKKSNELVSVTFLKHFSPYNKDEIAGFEKDFAEKLVKEKVAKFTK